ncbi:hypothetical protein J2I47_06485 [Fibrella sp. HMF5335]|uniref:WD40-like Beta Propeller Repeat n=1 Tax=Fibrella rubiginis TaxID=2817060 RepID=A0A939K408_9BACT|nr:hypothetical protein [Fibrella rubiginis]MBO0936188.1 hypothetical protein [Fibrella rubiginis]
MRFFPFAFLLLTAFTAVGQGLPILDQNPSSLRWYRINTPHFRVIYPAGFEAPARRTAQRLEEVYEPDGAGLERRPRPLSVVLQNQTTVSNGFATLYPRHAEFFTTPPQDPALLGTNTWTDLLAVHEYRHIVQYEKALQGYGRVLYTLLGAQGLSFPAQIVTPGWFLEGDAVGTETILTRSGRGRIPEFELGMRTNLLTRPVFSFAKATGGSFRDNVPNHYELGYFLTTKLKRSYGPNAWSKALNRIYTQFPFYPFSFSNGLKQSTKSAENPGGTSVDALYRETMNDLIETWKKKREGLTITPATLYPVLAEKARTEPSDRTRPVFTNYRFPQYLSDSTILCIKSGLGDIAQLVLLSRNGVEKRVYKQGLILNDPAYFSATPQRACWIENRFDPRWRSRIYGEIKLLDLTTGTLRRLSTRGRYTAVALSPDSQKLIALRNETDNQNRLVVLDANTGRELSILPNPANDLYVHPRWHNNRQIVTVTLSKAGKTIAYIDTQTGDKRALMPVANVNISHPQSYGNTHILFNSPQSGIDNIYAVEIASGQVSQVTSRPFGAYHATVSPNIRTMAVQDYDTHGFRVAELPLDPAAWPPITAQTDQTTRYFGPLPDAGNQTLTPIVTDSIPALSTSPPQRYRRLTNALNVYGWGPAFSSNGQGLTVGIQSQDILATTQVSAAYVYDQSEKVGAFAANLSYQGLYPVLDVGFQTGNRRTSVYLDRVLPLDSLRTDTWHYNQLTAGIRLPLVLTQSRFNQSASLSAYYGFMNVTGYDLPGRLLTESGNGNLHTLTYGAAYSYTLRQSYRDVGPRLGVTMNSSIRHTPLATATGQLRGMQWGSSVNVFLPGVGKHHSLRLRGAYQYQWGTPDANRLYRFQASVLYPRGAPYVAFDNLTVVGADYRLPLADVHWSLTRLLYVQRIKGNLFSDYARGTSNVIQTDTRGVPRAVVPVSSYDWTVGADISFVFNPLRLRTPLELGLRTIYDIRRQQWLVQPLVIDIGF